jgi:macrodomain Ter protein organizer (MatP/YcbG family)
MTQSIVMKFSKDIPDIYARCHERFGVEWDNGVIFAWGDTIYCKEDITQDMMEHEATHLLQQEPMGVDAWWDKYMEDDAFRLSQEVEAYRNQYLFIQKHIKDRNALTVYKHKIAKQLSSSIYGNICTYNEALDLLK